MFTIYLPVASQCARAHLDDLLHTNEFTHISMALRPIPRTVLYSFISFLLVDTVLCTTQWRKNYVVSKHQMRSSRLLQRKRSIYIIYVRDCWCRCCCRCIHFYFRWFCNNFYFAVCSFSFIIHTKIVSLIFIYRNRKKWRRKKCDPRIEKEKKLSQTMATPFLDKLQTFYQQFNWFNTLSVRYASFLSERRKEKLHKNTMKSQLVHTA